MPLNHCLGISSLDPADAADVRALVRAHGGDEVAGVQAYIDGLLADMDDIRTQIGGDVFFQPAYHGSPHVFDRFSTDHMGSGEGAQAFGWGLYFADKKGVAELYRRELSSSRVISPDGEVLGGDTVGQFEELVASMIDFGSNKGIATEPERYE